MARFERLCPLLGLADRDEGADEFDEVERRGREQRRAFFRDARRPSPAPGSPPHEATETVDSGARKRPLASVASSPELGAQGQLRSLRSLDGPVTPAAIIPATQGDSAHRRNALAARFLGSPLADETVIPDSGRQLSRTILRRSRSTPQSWGPSRVASLATGPPSPSLRRPSTKRPRMNEADEGQRPLEGPILAGLVLFYIPDNDIAPARRLRIGKAREYGAVWTRDASRATHIVVDRGLDYQDVVKVLGGSAPAGLAKMVNEDYPIDCIRFRTLLDDSQGKYQVAGRSDEAGYEGGGGKAIFLAAVGSERRL